MSLEGLQLFLTTYLRDPRFRQLYRGGGGDELLRQFDLTDADRELAKKIDLDDLDHTAQDFREERGRKRAAEFTPFVNHLAVYGPIEQLYDAYDWAFTDGLLTRPLEMDRFLAFAADFVTARRLPGYLLDLLRFSYHCSKLAETPREPFDPKDRVLDAVPETGLEAYHRLHLRRPFRFVQFRYDVVRLAQSQPSTDLAGVPFEPTELFLQKSWTLAKRSLAIDVRELPFVRHLAERPQTVVDLVGIVPPDEVGAALAHITDLVQRGIAGMSVPAHFVVAPKS
jgi:hypothetical protein